MTLVFNVDNLPCSSVTTLDSAFNALVDALVPTVVVRSATSDCVIFRLSLSSSTLEANELSAAVVALPFTVEVRETNCSC